LSLTGGAAKVLQDLTPDGYEARIDLTITDDFPLAAAIVIISGIPEKGDRR
jgi:holo-[acyl-carrier protein] synthase